MNANRSTNVLTPLSYLNCIQRGSTEDWKRLYQLCADPAVARDVAEILRQRDPDLMASARLWKFLLEDLHPALNLEIDLQPEAGAIGV